MSMNIGLYRIYNMFLSFLQRPRARRKLWSWHLKPPWQQKLMLHVLPVALCKRPKQLFMQQVIAVHLNGNDEDGHPTIEYRDGIKKRNLLNFNSHLYMIEVSIFHVRDAQHGVTIASWAAIYTFIRHSHFFHSLPCQTGSWLHSHSAVYRRM
jgi:hypothetical protein